MKLELSPKVKIGLALTTLGIAVLGCRNPIPPTPIDPIGQNIRDNNGMYFAEKTAQANASPVPNYPATEAAGNNELPNSTSCTLIKKNGNVGDAILRLGAWPDPNAIQAPLGQVVGLYASETAEAPSNLASVDEIVSGKNTSMNNVNEGNEVCVANNVRDLFKNPRPSPESSIPSQPAKS